MISFIPIFICFLANLMNYYDNTKTEYREKYESTFGIVAAIFYEIRYYLTRMLATLKKM